MDHPAHTDAVAHLSRVDPVLRDLIARVNHVTPAPSTDGSHLGAIARAIVFQQLSGRAAGTIHGRFQDLFGGRAPTADELVAMPDERLRSVGLSRAKTAYLKDLARRVVSGELPVERLHELDDDALLETLTAVKGIGRWTAQMFLMFRLGRPNVLPDLDLGVRKAIQYVYGLRRLPTPQQVLKRGAPWAPYASFAAWYLWRSLELSDAAPPRRVVRRRTPPAAKPKRRRPTGTRKSAPLAGTTRVPPATRRAPPATKKRRRAARTTTRVGR